MSRVSIGAARGSFSDEAAAQLFGEGSERIVAPGFRAAREMLDEGLVQACVLPFDNSSVGPVPEVHDLFLEGEVSVVAEHVLPVRHQLLALPGVPRSQLGRVLSHPMALAQCAGFLRREGLEPVASADTAASAEKLVRERPPGTGVIASRRVAALQGLEVVAEDVQDANDNATRFVVLRRPGAADGAQLDGGSSAGGTASRTFPGDGTGGGSDEASPSWKALTAVWPRGGPKGLGPLLRVWEEAGLEVTRLVSRSGRMPFSSVYFVDLVHPTAERLNEALTFSERHAAALRVFGVFAVGRPSPLR